MSDGTSALTPDPTIFILYGATGDLAHRLVLPAFFRLAIAGLLPTDWRLIGNGRGDVSHEDFQERMRESLEEFGPKPSQGPWDEVRARLRFAGGGFDSLQSRLPARRGEARPKTRWAGRLSSSTTWPSRRRPSAP